MTATSDLPEILVIDDEIGPRESLRMLLKPDYNVHTADNVEAGLKLLKEKQPDTIVMDIRMPGMTGIEGLRKIREIDPHLSVIMLTGFADLYNIFNTNANQAMTTSSGASFLRPTAITPPRIARFGVKFRF